MRRGAREVYVWVEVGGGGGCVEGRGGDMGLRVTIPAIDELFCLRSKVVEKCMCGRVWV